MRIIEPSFKIERADDCGLHGIERAGRTCYKSEAAITDDSAKSFCRRILKSGHESVIEHSVATVRIICDRGVTHEIVRHRLASYSQESTRYCNYTKDKYGGHITFIKPCFFPDIPLGEYGTVREIEQANHSLTKAALEWCGGIVWAELCYNNLIGFGCTPQEARSVLPNSLKTEIVMTCNLRQWRHFFKLRTANAAHPQMQEIARPMLDKFKSLYPVLFDDITY